LPFYDQIDLDPWLSAPDDNSDATNDVLASPNVTSDPSGVAYYDERIFIQTIRTGRVARIRALRDAMPWSHFRTRTD
jgi:hypothetical protein